jgi:hypothetical protein
LLEKAHLWKRGWAFLPQVIIMTTTGIFTSLGILLGVKLVAERFLFEKQRKQRKSYYRENYLKTDDWKRKRSLVLKRDGRRCIICGGPATQVHHKKYAPRNIGREPIDWLISVCDSCHKKQHEK